MSEKNERVSDEELERFIQTVPEHDWMHSVFKELQQRRKTDRAVIEAYNSDRLAVIRDVAGLKLTKAISDLQP